MNNRKATKRALLTSVMALALCVVMLVGTTFAWFTDTAKTSVNKIEAGNLDVELYYADNATGEDAQWTQLNNDSPALNFVKAEGAEDEEVLWEPGCTYNLPALKIVNNGNLKLKYKVEITGINGDAKLNEVIKWTIKNDGTPTTTGGIEYALNAKSGNVVDYDIITISGTMDKNAGNEYQNETIDGASITVYATQMTGEFDSFKSDYDKNATYPVADYTALQKAFEGSGVYNVTENVDVKDTLTLTGFNALTLDATGKTISNTEDLWDESTNGWSLLSARGSSYLTVAGGEFKAKENDGYAVDVQDGATVTIEDGTFIGNIHAVYVQKGTAYIKGGFFSVQQKYPEAAKANEFVLNCYDANREAGTAKIIVTGGTFVNFNPADCYAEGAHTNFVADGYKVVSEAHDSDTWYTVIPA